MARIPASQDDFDKYIVEAISFLLATPSGGGVRNGVRLGLTDTNPGPPPPPPPPPPAPQPPPGGELGQLYDAMNTWRNSSDTGIYQLLTKKETRTSVVRANVKKFMKDFRIAFQPMLNRMANSPAITPGDRDILNIAQPRTGTGSKEATIDLVPVLTMINLGGGKFKLYCRASELTKRAAIPKDADSVQLAYSIADTNNPGPVNVLPQISSTRAIVVVNLGTDHVGKYMRVSARYYNARKPELAGGWSTSQVFLIG